MVRTSTIAAGCTTVSYTLAEAAAACGLDKSTVRRAVRSGRISGTRDDLGVWHVDAAELHRVFPPVARPEGDTTAVPRDAPAKSADNTTDVLVAELRAVIADLRQDRDRWCAEAEHWRLQAQQGTPRQIAATPQGARWWRWRRTPA